MFQETPTFYFKLTSPTNHQQIFLNFWTVFGPCFFFFVVVDGNLPELLGSRTHVVMTSHTIRLGPSLRKICVNFEKVQACPKIAEFTRCCVRSCDRKIRGVLEGPLYNNDYKWIAIRDYKTEPTVSIYFIKRWFLNGLIPAGFIRVTFLCQSEQIKTWQTSSLGQALNGFKILTC